MMIYATRILIVLSIASLISCNDNTKEQALQNKLDSIRKADSISLVVEKQRIIDSVETVIHEQEIIADSIMNQVNRQE